MKNKKIFKRLLFSLMGLFLVFAIGCDNDADVPVLSTIELTGISQNTARSGGNITNDGGAMVTARGVCWSTNENPTIDDNKTEDGTYAGRFTSSITGLESNTTYNLRAYATNSAGTAYGREMTFSTLEDFTDPRDGKVYPTVIIGNQEWMAENLAYIPSSGNYWAYENDETNVDIYGYLYDWPTALTVCPTGWQLPGNRDWAELTYYLGGESVAGGKLKATGTTYWNSPNTGATNETGFTALPGGNHGMGEAFFSIGQYGHWWSATEFSANHPMYAWSRFVHYNSSYLYSYDFNDKELGFSVRCLRNY